MAITPVSNTSGYNRYTSGFDTDRVHWTTDVEFNDGDPVHQARRGNAARLDPADIVDSKDFKTLTADVDTLLAKKDLSASDRSALGKVHDFLQWFVQQFGHNAGDIDSGGGDAGGSGAPGGGTGGTAEVASLMQKLFAPFANLFKGGAASTPSPAPGPSSGESRGGGHPPHWSPSTPSPAAPSPAPVDPHHPSQPPSTGPVTGGLSAAALAANPALRPYAAEIAAASKATGIPPETIGAMIWAESRGNMSTKTINGDKSEDIGLMQIGQERLAKDNLSQAQKDAIKKATGREWNELNVSNPADNIMAGAFHLKHFIDQENGDVDAGLADYVGRDPKYVTNIHTFRGQLERGVALTEDAGTPIPG